MPSMEGFPPPPVKKVENIIEKKNFDEMLAVIEEQLSKDPSTDTEFINNRLKELNEAPNVDRSEISHMGKAVHEGYIPHEKNIIRSMQVDPLRLDDPEIFLSLMSTLREFKSIPGWSERSMKSYYLNAIQHSLGGYFGNYTGDNGIESENRQVYLNNKGDINPENRFVSIKQFKRSNVGVCAEKGPTAQNMLAFAGAESKLIASADCRIPADVEPGAHYFILLTTPNETFIYDPTNPSLLTDTEDKIIDPSPSLYKLTPEQQDTLLSGGAVTVTHIEGKRDANGNITKVGSQWVYTGPRGNK